jgi:hypothetical protein
MRRGPTADEIQDLEWLLHEIDLIPGCSHTKAEVRRVLRTLAGRRIYFKRALVSRPHEVAQALAFLGTGRSVAETRDALMEHAQVSRRKAYELIHEALNKRAPVQAQLPLQEADKDGS